jgi:hypothetical protein
MLCWRSAPPGSPAGYTLLDGRREFTRTSIRQLLMGDTGHIKVDVDAVQQRPADPLLIATLTPVAQMQPRRTA